MLTVRTSENTVITSFRLISERQDFSSVRTVRTPFARVREFKFKTMGKLKRRINFFKNQCGVIKFK